MKKLLLAVCGLVIGAAMVVTDVDAKKLGGGRSMGAQRNVTPPASAPVRPGQQAAPPDHPQRTGLAYTRALLNGDLVSASRGSFDIYRRAVRSNRKRLRKHRWR